MSAANKADAQRVSEAAEWCRRLAEGLDRSEDRASFDAWIAACPSNRATMARMAAIWSGARAVADHAELIGVRADALERVRVANRNRWSGLAAASYRQVAATAACLLVLLAVAGAIFLRQGPDTYATGIGERQVVRLADGSKVSLDAASRVEVDYSAHGRTLRLLDGRAKFDVAKDPLRPFTVTAGQRMVVATGTSFSVELVEREMRVVLYEGRVAVLEAPPEGEPRQGQLQGIRANLPDGRLRPGTELVAGTGAKRATLREIDPVGSLSWEGGQLTFSDEPLGLAAARMNRYSDWKLEVSGPAADIPVSGVFNAGDAEAFVDGLGELYPLVVRRIDGKIRISSVSPAV